MSQWFVESLTEVDLIDITNNLSNIPVPLEKL